MQEYNTIIGKLLAGINRKQFKRSVDKYRGDFAVKKLNCWEQFVSIFLGQITQSSSLREIVDLIKFHSNQQYHLGIRKDVARSTLAKANETRDWRIYRDVFYQLIAKLKNSSYYRTAELVKIIDSTPINLDLIKHPWIETTMKVKGLKTHVVFDLTNRYPILFDITGARTNDINWAKTIKIEKGTTYVADRGYTDYNWWFDINLQGGFFVTRLKRDARIREITELQSNSDGICSQLFVLTNKHPGGKRINNYANIPLKRVIVERDGKSPLILVTNDFNRSDKEIAELYKQRWQIELFFKWIKQNLKIKKFLGKSENAIRTQICISLISFVLLRMAEELKDVCQKISSKNLLKIVGNSLFNCLKVRNYGRKKYKNPNQFNYGRKKYKNPNQLQFEWILTI